MLVTPTGNDEPPQAAPWEGRAHGHTPHELFEDPTAATSP